MHSDSRSLEKADVPVINMDDKTINFNGVLTVGDDYTVRRTHVYNERLERIIK